MRVPAYDLLHRRQHRIRAHCDGLLQHTLGNGNSQLEYVLRQRLVQGGGFFLHAFGQLGEQRGLRRGFLRTIFITRVKAIAVGGFTHRALRIFGCFTAVGAATRLGLGRRVK